MKLPGILIILLFTSFVFGQSTKNVNHYKKYDSIVVQTFNDYSYEMDFETGNRMDTIIVTGRAAISFDDAKRLNQRIRQKESYGESQAVTPIYDLNIKYYHQGKVKEIIEISLWTNNLFASFPLKVQRQGECLCKGNGGYCCTEGGINRSFKIYLLDLLEKYNLPSDREELLNFGE